jgi:glutathione S-transferase
MSNIHVYMFPGVGSRITLNALEEIGLSYTHELVNFRKGEQNSDPYLAINPKGRVPTVIIDGSTLTETPAILWYLHTVHPAAKLLPADDNPVVVHQQLADLCWMSNYVHPSIRQIRQPGKWTTGEHDGVEADGRAKFGEFARGLNRRLSEQPFWYQAGWSVMDVYAYWAYSTVARVGFALPDFPALVEHQERVRARPSFQRVLAVERQVAERASIAIDL